jgi:outer membrane protein, multidrug efflux system
LDVAYARFNEASANYKQQVLTAFQEVENALNNLEHQSKQYASLQAATAAAEKNAGLSLQRYKGGLVNSLDVLNYEQFKFNAELNLNGTLGQRYVSTIQVIEVMVRYQCL